MARGVIMEIEILKNEKDYLEVAIKGEDIGFINAIKELLFDDSDVEFAAYRLDHPIVASPVLMVRMKKELFRRLKPALLKQARNLTKIILLN